jgi:hypothetical protein
MPSSSISLGVQLTPNDLYRANVWHLARKLWFLWLIPILAIASMLLSLFSGAQQRQQLMLNIRPLIYLAGVYLLIVFVLPYFSARSNFRSQKALQQTTNYTFSEEGIQTESETASSRTDWSNVHQVVETGSYLFVYLAKNLRYVIPKRCVPDAEELVVLRQILRAGVKGKIKLRG